MKYIIKDGGDVLRKGFIRKGISYTYWFNISDFPKDSPKYFDTYESAEEFIIKFKLSNLFTRIVPVA